MRLFALLLAVLSLAPLPVAAQSRLGEIVEIELLDGGAARAGTHLAGLRLRLAPGWKTYWRAPGDAGIPPAFSWAGSQNLAGATPVWPTPMVFDQGGMTSIGYAGDVVIPFEVTPTRPGQPVRIAGEIDFGVCADVCVPARLSFAGTLDPGAGPNPAVAAAMAARPLSGAEAGLRSATCEIRPSGDGLRVTATLDLPDTGGRETVVFEAGDPEIWTSPAEVRREGGRLLASSDLVHVAGAPFALDRSALRLTVLGARHGVDILGCQAG